MDRQAFLILLKNSISDTNIKIINSQYHQIQKRTETTTNEFIYNNLRSEISKNAQKMYDV